MRVGGQVQQDSGLYPKGVGDCSWICSSETWSGESTSAKRAAAVRVEGEAQAGRDRGVWEPAAVWVPVSGSCLS